MKSVGARGWRVAWLVALVAAIVSSALLVVPGPTPVAEGAEVVPGRVVVKFRFGALARSAQATYGALSVEERPALGAQVWRVAPGTERDVARQLAARWDVAYAEPATTMQWLATPNDPYYAVYGWNLSQIDAPTAWDITRGSPSVKVAVIDSGFDVTHPDRPANLELGCDFAAWPENLLGQRIGPCPPVSVDTHGHGTHVAGIVAARWNNASYIAGVAPNVRLLVIRSGDEHGSNTIDVADAIVSATDAGARVINMSLGGTEASDYRLAAVQYAVDRGVLIVAAAGNCGTVSAACPVANPTLYPAAYSLDFPTGVIGVAAVAADGTRAAYSNVGQYVQIAAPGGRGTAANATPAPTDSVTSLYPLALGGAVQAAGTSMAAPHVAAVAGLILSIRPDLTPLDVIDILQLSAEQDDPDDFPNEELGYGRLNASTALTLAQTYEGSATQTPTRTPTTSVTATPVLTGTPTPTVTRTPFPTSSATQPTPTALPASTPISPYGGTLTTDNGAVTVEAPNGAFPQGVTLIYRPQPAIVVEPLAGTRRLHGFELTTSPPVLPEGELIVRITIGEGDVAGVNPRALRLLRVVDGSGRREALPTEWVAAARQVRAQVRSLGTFELVVQLRQLLPVGWR